MIERVKASGIPFAWVAADALHGDDVDLRTWLEDQGLPYVLAVHSDEPVALLTEQGMRLLAVKDGIQLVDAEQRWQRLSMGEGTKGARMFDWGCLSVWHRGLDDQHHWLLIRRSVVDPTDFAFYLVYGPSGTTVQEMVWVVGARWKIEEIFEAAKEEVGFDQYEVRLWTSWYRHITLAMLVHAYLTVMRAQTRSSDPADSLEMALELLPLTLAEVRHLLWQTAWSHVPPLRFILAWSLWRRRHQAAASRSHTKRRHSTSLTNATDHPLERRQHHRRKNLRGERRGQRGIRLLTQVQYTADGRYLLIEQTGARTSLVSDGPEWKAVLENVPSFHFAGKNGRFTARKENVQGKGYYWYAYRKHHNKQSKQYIGTTAKLSPDVLEQVAAALQTKIELGSGRREKEAML